MKVTKTEFGSHWVSYFDEVTERLGPCPDSDNCFSSLEEACQKSVERQKKHALRVYENEVIRVSELDMKIYRLRSLWNKTVRLALAQREERLEELRQACENTPSVKVNSIPDELEFEGERLAVGDTLYRVDIYNFVVEARHILAEQVTFYHHQNFGKNLWVRYNVDNQNTVNPKLESSVRNFEYYKTLEEARARAEELIQARVTALEESIKALL